MTKRIRTAIFGVLAILFLIAAPLTVLYALGWRFDFDQKQIYQTGIFYFKATPKNAEMYIDGQFQDRTDIFFGSILVNNLIPKDYNIEIRKPGYHSFAKNLPIVAKEVTEASNITLIPEQISLNPVLDKIETIYQSIENDLIITKETNEGRWGLKSFNLKNSVKSHLLDENEFSDFDSELVRVVISPDGNKLLLEIRIRTSDYYLLDISGEPTLTDLEYLDIGSIDEIHFLRDDLLIIQTIVERNQQITTLNKVDVENAEIEPWAFKDAVTVSVFGNNVYYLNNTGALLKLNQNLENPEKLNISNINYSKNKDYQIIISEPHLFLKSGSSLYFLDPKTRLFKLVSDNVLGQAISPDNKKIAHWDNHEIRVMYLEPQYDQPTREKNENIFITRFSGEIKDVYWYNNFYLIFDVDNTIKVSETDNRDKLNIVDSMESKHQGFFWINQKLYLLNEDTLLSSDILQ